ncbi:response regulator [Aeoliella mucimassa]|uniref:Response regulator rcp1 n=1 Tax=Aeoliella mucimassa TaxID=2527972 RepID=A0A518AI08_9BACT|nr:response regulator [Aeoliella mucimassa]QDU54345.1 Response regulator rcp1 [Aeoliella mucimassa]
MSMNRVRPVRVLLVEDDEEDVVLIKKTLERDRLLIEFHHACDGVDAMSHLHDSNENPKSHLPDLILLDLNMPRMDGREVLRQCSEDPKLRSIPIVVFTSSDDERDVLESYNLKASSFVSKPVDLAQFRNVLREIGEYWFCIVRLPPVTGAAT